MKFKLGQKVKYKRISKKIEIDMQYWTPDDFEGYEEKVLERRDMDNLEYLKGIKGADGIWHKSKNINYIEIIKQDFYEYRKVKALEIIAEELVIFNKNFKSLIGGEATHSIRTMSMMGG